MKPENNDLSRAAFFATYWGQNCICNDEYVWRSNETFDTVLSIYNGDLSGWYARLTPLSKIMDEDAITFFEILFPDHITTKTSEVKALIAKDCWIVHIGKEMSLKPAGWEHGIDYLRSRSYLLPWMGLTPDEIIERKWAKYKED